MRGALLPVPVLLVLVLLALGAAGCTRPRPASDGRSAPEMPPTTAHGTAELPLSGPSSTAPSLVAGDAALRGFHTHASDYDFESTPGLIERIVGSAYGYFRFTNRGFAQRVCERWRDRLADMPTVNLHGDAHLEQYAVTSDGRGLDDFDDASFGPPVIDLLRFLASIRVAASELGWADTAADASTAFLRGYRDALIDPAMDPPAPEYALRVRSGFTGDTARFLSHAVALMEPVPVSRMHSFHAGYEQYVDAALRRQPHLDRAFFRLKELGALHLGFGSALDEKYLLRIEGLTESPLDDVILEAKEVRDFSAVDCLEHSHGSGVFRVLIGRERLTDRPAPYLGHFDRKLGDEDVVAARSFWVQSWRVDYQELQVAHAFQSPQELVEVSYDVGVQLGRGHTLKIADPHRVKLCGHLVGFLDGAQDELLASVEELVQETLAGWQRFRREVSQGQAAPD